MTFPRIKPSLNGKVEAPSPPNGASLIPPKPTTFPTEPVQSSSRTLLYWASRRQLAGLPLLRWLLLLLFCAALLWALGGLAGRWWVAALTGGLWLLLLVLFYRARRRDFVQFTPLPLPALSPARLEPQAKAPIYATGLFSVENKYQRFTWLPGFYRTFATREHALLCQLRQPTWGLLGQLPSEAIGLWYIFFEPAQIVRVVYGRLAFGSQPKPAIAVTYQITIPKRNRLQPEQVRNEVVYVATATEADAMLILADLCYDLPQSADVGTTISS